MRYIQMVVPNTFCDRHASISVLRNSAWPTIDWYSCRLNAASPYRPMSTTAASPKNLPVKDVKAAACKVAR